MKSPEFYDHVTAQCTLPTKTLAEYIQKNLNAPRVKPQKVSYDPHMWLDFWINLSTPYVSSLRVHLNANMCLRLSQLEQVQDDEARFWLTALFAIDTRKSLDEVRTHLEQLRDTGQWLQRAEIVANFEERIHIYVYDLALKPYIIQCLDALLEPEQVMSMAARMSTSSHNDPYVPFTHLRAFPANHEITRRRVKALLEDEHFVALVNKYKQKPYDRSILELLRRVPSDELFDACFRREDGSLLGYDHPPVYLAHDKDFFELSKLAARRLFTEQELVALIARRYDVDEVDYTQLIHNLEAQRRLHDDRTNRVLPDALSHVHDPAMIPYMYELTRKGHHDMKPYLEEEGANAIEGLVAMCARKGSKRDFAIHILKSYVERGHHELIAQSFHQLSARAQRLTREELFLEKNQEDADTTPQQHYSLDEETIEQKLALLTKFPFDDRASITLSYGGRHFEVHLDANASINVLDKETRKVVKTLPAARPDEDAYHINAFRDMLTVRKREAKKRLRKDLQELEERFRKMTYWNKEEWIAWVKKDALRASMASSFVWGIYDKEDKLESAFYMDAQGQLMDADYEPFTLPKAAQITLVHPLDLDAQQLATWSTFMAELERVQLFEQLARTTIGPDEWEEERAWQEATFAGREALSIALRKYPGWYADFLRRGNQAKRWFAKRILDFHGKRALLVVHANTWDAISPDVPHRSGLHILEVSAPYHTASSLDWHTLPARQVSELCLTLRDVGKWKR